MFDNFHEYFLYLNLENKKYLRYLKVIQQEFQKERIIKDIYTT